MRPSDPFIPPEALARQARLHAALRAMETTGNSLEPACLQRLRASLTETSPQPIGAWVETIQQADQVEEACDLLRGARREAVDQAFVQSLLLQLAPLALKTQQRRSALWQLDTRRTLIRVGFAKEGASLSFDDGDIHALFLQAFRLEGLRLALDLGKRARPLLGVGLPLPAEVGGVAECFDVVLKHEPPDEPINLMTRLNLRLPPGLRLHHWNPLPAYASEVSELALSSIWQWAVPRHQSRLIQSGVSTFLNAKIWLWERGDSKSETALDLRTIITDMQWMDGGLGFKTRMGALQAINPLKMLGAIFGLDPATIRGLVRLKVDFKLDARVGQGERFEPKLKNMYEDAVLLGGGSNIILVDEDDDEPLRLGPPSPRT